MSGSRWAAFAFQVAATVVAVALLADQPVRDHFGAFAVLVPALMTVIALALLAVHLSSHALPARGEAAIRVTLATSLVLATVSVASVGMLVLPWVLLLIAAEILVWQERLAAPVSGVGRDVRRSHAR